MSGNGLERHCISHTIPEYLDHYFKQHNNLWVHYVSRDFEIYSVQGRALESGNGRGSVALKPSAESTLRVVAGVGGVPLCAGSPVAFALAGAGQFPLAPKDFRACPQFRDLLAKFPN